MADSDSWFSPWNSKQFVSESVCMWIVIGVNTKLCDSDWVSLSSALLSITCLPEGSHENMNDDGSCEGELCLVNDSMHLWVLDSGTDTRKTERINQKERSAFVKMMYRIFILDHAKRIVGGVWKATAKV